MAGTLPLREFTPKVFKAVRQSFVDAKNSRTTINGRMQKIGQFVKWCVAEELCDPSLHAALKSVPGLRKGRGEAKELPAVRPPSEPELERIIEKLPPAAAALARIQSLCGARAGELVRLRADAIDRTGPVWKAVVCEHKGTWRGKGRTLYFGPSAQAVITPLLFAAAGGFLFLNERKRPYKVNGYRQALQRACALLSLPEYGTHAIRHYAAIRIRRMVDVEMARVLLSHSDLGLTAEVYAQFDAIATAQKLFNEVANLPGGVFLTQPDVSSYCRGKKLEDRSHADRFVHEGLEEALRQVKNAVPTHTVCPWNDVDAPHPDKCHTCLDQNWTPVLGNNIPDAAVRRAKEAHGV